MLIQPRFKISIAAINAGLATLTLGLGYDYLLIKPFAFFSIFLFAVLCFLERKNILFLARTFFLGIIGYFPMIVKVLLGKEAIFSAYEESTQGFNIVVLMYVATSYALLSNQIGLALAKKSSLVYSNKDQVPLKGCQRGEKQTRQGYWWIAGVIGFMLTIFSSIMFIRAYGNSILTASYASSDQGGEGVKLGSICVFGSLGIFSLLVAGMKGYIKNWKLLFIIACFTFIVYSQLLRGLRQDSMSTLFGLLILYGVAKRSEIGLKLSYIPILLIFYAFFEIWGFARFALSQGVSITSIATGAFSTIGSTDAFRAMTISPIATTFSNVVWLIDKNIISYSFGQSYFEWILRIPPEALFPDRPIDYAWMFEKYGLLAGGGFFELAEVYMNFGLLGSLIIPGLISFLIAKSYFYAFCRQSMISYFLLFSFLTIFLRGTWYQTFAFFRSFTVCISLYFIYVFIVQIFLDIIKRKQRNNFVDLVL